MNRQNLLQRPIAKSTNGLGITKRKTLHITMAHSKEGVRHLNQWLGFVFGVRQIFLRLGSWNKMQKLWLPDCRKST